MSLVQKVKKTISLKQQNELIQGKYQLVEVATGEIAETETREQHLFRFITFEQTFMKLWDSHTVCRRIDVNLSLADMGLLYKIGRGYMDHMNRIDFDLLAEEYGYDSSRLSVLRKSLKEKGIIRKLGKSYYLNPLIAIKAKEISQHLINLFQDTFEGFGVRAESNRSK